VELIQRFGTLESLLDHAAEIERKTYRESLENNREAILLSKQLVTIDRNVAVDFEPETMRAQEPDADAARALFTELEFTTLVQDFLTENVELGETDYREAKSAKDIENLVLALKPGTALAVAIEAGTTPQAQSNDDAEEESEPAGSGQLSFGDAPQVAAAVAALRVAAAAEPNTALSVSLDDSAAGLALKRALEDETLSKTIHDAKTATHVLGERGVTLHGVQHDPLLYSYLLDPTYSTYGLREVAQRRFNLKLAGSVAEAADITLRLTDKLREQVEDAGLTKVYDEIDLPLVAGAALFGIGWGLVGLCPGPALESLATLSPGIIVFVVAMAAGMMAHDAWQQSRRTAHRDRQLASVTDG